MSRKPRIHFPGAVYHIILRGNGGQDVFFDEADRSRFCFLLQTGTERFHHRVHAFCFMSNHLHLAVQVQDVPLARIMQNLGFRYTQYINRKLEKTGHLFQGRYKALLIDADSYLLELVRYIHLNPVRAGIVSAPDAFSWSSHRAYLGLEKLPWLTTDWVLGQLGQSSAEAVGRYGRYAAEGLGEGYRRDFHGGSFEGRALGSDRFIEEALVQAEEPVPWQPSLSLVLESVCAAYAVTRDELCSRSRERRISEARAAAALLVRETEGLALVDLGKLIHQELSSLSQSARRMELRIQEDRCRGERFEVVKSKVENPICQA